MSTIPTTVQIRAALTIAYVIMREVGFSREQHPLLARKLYADALQSVMEYGIPKNYNHINFGGTNGS